MMDAIEKKKESNIFNHVVQIEMEIRKPRLVRLDLINQKSSGLEVDWKWTGSGLEVDWKWTGSGLEVDWKWTGSGLEADNIIESVGIPIINYHELGF